MLKILKEIFTFHWKINKIYRTCWKKYKTDSGVVEGSEISMYYDPMISKLCVHSETREKSISLMTMALDRYLINGVNTNKDFLSNIIQNNSFKKADFSTKFYF